MFGRRSDGKRIRNIDPIVSLTPYLMPMRCDAQVMMDFKVDFEKLTRYIAAKREEGYQITFLEILIAAFVHTVAEIPEANRFIVNKQLYARKDLTVAFTVLKEGSSGVNVEENTVKCKFLATDTIYDVTERVKQAVEASKKEDADNTTMKLAKVLANPLLANPLVGLIRFLDRVGLLPGAVVDASPFHTSVFMTNMASIGMPAVKHHIYNFGTTSMFFSIGMVERTAGVGPDGKAVRKRMLPLGVVADERICAGAVYARLVDGIMKGLNDPSILEKPAENIRYEEVTSYRLDKAEEKRLQEAQKHITA